MKDCENILVQIGELVCVEIEEVKDVVYNVKENGKRSSFTIIMKDGRKFTVEVKVE